MGRSRKRACDSCYRRKIRCDGVVPQCNWCQHHDLTCTFDRVFGAKKVAKSARNLSEKDLALRLERIEEALARNIPKSEANPQGTSVSPPSIASSPDCPTYTDPGNNTSPDSLPTYSSEPSAQSPSGFGKLHFAGYHLGAISSYNGIPFFSPAGRKWIESRTGENAAFETLCASGPPWQTQHRVHPSFLSADFRQSSLNLELPERKLVEECLRIFRSSFFKLVFPIIDTVLFQHTIDLAYEPWRGPPSLEPVNAKACIFSFFSVMSLLQADLEMPPLPDGDAYAVKAQYLLPIMLQETNLTVLQTVFMLSMYQVFSGQLQTAALYHSLACRMMFTLGAHTQSGSSLALDQPASGTDHAWRVKSHLRKIFWLCYTFDKEISLRTGQPPSIDDENCNLTLPQGYVDTLYPDKLRDASLLDDTAMPELPGDLRLSILKSKTYKALYSAEALQKSDADLLRDIRELDDELDKWRLTIPPKYRPTLSYSFKIRKELERHPHLGMKIIITHFEYHHLMATIHRASGRCRAWANGESGELEGVSSSLALSVEASRATLYSLRAAIHTLFGAAFWMIVFYPMSAILTIFCNILSNPLDPGVTDDLELLDSTPELIKGIRTHGLTLNEITYMKSMDDFVGELTRLGNHAITKARQDRNRD